MLSDIQCTPVEVKNHFKLSLKTKDGKTFEQVLERYEIRQLIGELDNAI
jgi:hypothetical protein